MKTTLYVSEEFLNKLDSYIKAEKMKSRSEFICKAVDFYIDYNVNKEAGTFLAREIQAIMTGNMDLVEKRLGNRFAKLMSDTAIQLGIVQQILKSISDITEDDIETFRKISVDEMRNSQKVLKYENL